MHFGLGSVHLPPTTPFTTPPPTYEESDKEDLKDDKDTLSDLMPLFEECTSEEVSLYDGYVMGSDGDRHFYIFYALCVFTNERGKNIFKKRNYKTKFSLKIKNKKKFYLFIVIYPYSWIVIRNTEISFKGRL